MRSGKAELIFREKLTSPKGLIREISLWRLKRSERYPDGVKYRLVLVDPRTGEIHLLYDNHWPKGHHVHVRGHERPRPFSTLTHLLQEFRARADEIEKEIP
jgi:hypothetical protein